ncbi:lipocalin family protein [Octadecabacter sp. 1_MG-2023]|uniref:lipocalin family protein n=1 Tax=unclassified Octadecabacter TaxID=196158 RepID=UPI001C0967F2|nr:MULTISPECIES: lipocalin family protein [unclassified Octadecabacter]MBU2992683.1 lipocalin family protein [Octadecabacter sp. B2R22]MDO6733866.1 lipocalin family protein [Octadecabacter sp. 1_MG-2023]
MKRIIKALPFVALAACLAEEPQVPEGAIVTERFRDQSAQIASQTDVTPDRMAGDWVIRQRFAGQPGPSHEISISTLPQGALQMNVVSFRCADGVCADVESLVLLEAAGPGRWKPAGDQTVLFDGEIWVMWMDFDTRTVAIGIPTGEFGWIMDKNPTGGGDRITAARDIMDWFGYDVSRLQEVRR